MANITTVIKSCTCANPGQDALYGKQQRVHNQTKDNPPKLRCTVCVKEK